MDISLILLTILMLSFKRNLTFEVENSSEISATPPCKRICRRRREHKLIKLLSCILRKQMVDVVHKLVLIREFPIPLIYYLWLNN